MIARGALGNPWVFEELTGRRSEPPAREEVAAELLWVIDRAEEHLGTERATATCASSTPGTSSALGLRPRLPTELQRSADLARARELIAAAAMPAERRT